MRIFPCVNAFSKSFPVNCAVDRFTKELKSVPQSGQKDSKMYEDRLNFL